ncbi:MAG: hypothetical protein PHX18_01240 [Candidatus Gastranaerophilales bacterium]|nr:hypothetical protein [Candidatus Gastranaerophilales bacterium]
MKKRLILAMALVMFFSSGAYATSDLAKNLLKTAVQTKISNCYHNSGFNLSSTIWSYTYIEALKHSKITLAKKLIQKIKKSKEK